MFAETTHSHEGGRACGTLVPSLLSDCRGMVMAEYAVLITVVALGSVAALVFVGAPLVRFFLMQQAWLLLSFP